MSQPGNRFELVLREHCGHPYDPSAGFCCSVSSGLGHRLATRSRGQSAVKPVLPDCCREIGNREVEFAFFGPMPPDDTSPRLILAELRERVAAVQQRSAGLLIECDLLLDISRDLRRWSQALSERANIKTQTVRTFWPPEVLVERSGETDQNDIGALAAGVAPDDEGR